MEISEPDPTTAATTDTDAPTRRKSSRVVRKPEIFSEDNFAKSLLDTTHTKRKRGSSTANARQEDESDASEESEDEDDESEGEADEEELKETRRRSRQKKPAAKKARVVNGTAAQLAIRPAPASHRVAKKGRAKKPRVRQSQAGDASGLYAKIFSQDKPLEEVVAEWQRVFDAENVQGVCDLVNFILKCTGGDLVVDIHDIEDVDNVTGRLSDLQDEYQAKKLPDYPLSSRNKQYVGFRDTLTSFFATLIESLHSSNLLYDDAALIENIQTWVSTMSSAAIRPFRHTATVISLAISNALCDVASRVQVFQSDTQLQLENERKQRRTSKEKVAILEKRIQECQAQLDTIDSILKDSFDAVFVHRYRDVDPKIRAECVQALGYWIATYQNMFFEGQYLRYLGWVLSDTVSHTRAEVVKQLRSLFGLRGSIARLKAFTERFRARLVEMASQDADPAVRAITAELLDVIRNAGLLEPDDIDKVGQLIFTAEPRVRKGVAKFFVSNIADVYLSNLREILEVEDPDSNLDEYFPNDDDNDFETPKRAWMKYKCLAEILTYYDSPPEDSTLHQNLANAPGSREILTTGSVDSRFMLATQAIYPHMPELHHWEYLAGYLLFDHSQIQDASDQDEISAQLKSRYKLEEGQDIILLQILVSAAPLRLAQVAALEQEKRGKRAKGRKHDADETPERVVQKLTQIIPLLLGKYGNVPAAASAVLRLEHVLDLGILEESQQGSTNYVELLEKINQQFLGHSDSRVLAEASAALLRAKSQDDLAEAIEDKLGDLWNETLSSLRSLTTDVGDLNSAGNLTRPILEELGSTISRIASLASISDPTGELLKTAAASQSARSKAPSGNLSSLQILQLLVARGETTLGDDEDAEDSTLEDTLVITSLKVITFFFMWSVRSILNRVSSNSNIASSDPRISSLIKLRDVFSSQLHTLLQVRSGFDPVRFAAARTLLDLYTLFGSLRQVKVTDAITQTNHDSIVRGMVKQIPSEDQTLITSLFTVAEKHYAKKSHRNLEPAEDDEPEDEDDEPEDDDDHEDADQAQELLAEQSLCELTGKIVLAIIGRVVDASGSNKGKLKQRLLRNQSKLGPNYKEVVKHLEEPRTKRRAKTRGKSKAPELAGETTARKSEALVVDGDDVEDGDAIEGQRDEEDEEGDSRELAEDEDIEVDLEPAEDEETAAAHGNDDDDDGIMGD